MKLKCLARPSEQRKVKKLLLQLSKVQPVSAKPAPIMYGQKALKSA